MLNKMAKKISKISKILNNLGTKSESCNIENTKTCLFWIEIIGRHVTFSRHWKSICLLICLLIDRMVENVASLIRTILIKALEEKSLEIFEWLIYDLINTETI